MIDPGLPIVLISQLQTAPFSATESDFIGLENGKSLGRSPMGCSSSASNAGEPRIAEATALGSGEGPGCPFSPAGPRQDTARQQHKPSTHMTFITSPAKQILLSACPWPLEASSAAPAVHYRQLHRK